MCNRWRVWIGVWASCGLLAAGCGGSAGSGNTDGSSGGSGGSTPTTESLKTLSSIPDLNLDSLDAALQSTAASLSKNLKATENSSTEFSRAGCELRSCVDEMKSSLLSFRVEKCAMEALEANTETAVGVDQYNYYAITLPEGIDDLDSEETFYLKVGYNADNDAALRIFLCEPHPTTNAVEHTLTTTYTVVNGQFVGTVTDILPADENPSETDAWQMAVELGVEDASTWSDGDTASISGAFNGYYGAGNIALAIAQEGALLTNEVTATFQSGDAESNWGTWTSRVHGKYDASEGCSRWASEGTYPGELVSAVFTADEQSMLATAGISASDTFCWKEADDPEDETTLADWVELADSNGHCSYDEGSDECFTFTLTGTTLDYFVLDTASAIYADAIFADALADFSEPTIAFSSSEVWDCSAPNGFTTIDLRSNSAALEDLETCFAFEADEEAERDINSCYDTEKEEDAEDDLGEDF